MTYAKAPWFKPSADYRLTCPCISCCLATGREPTKAAVEDHRDSLKLVKRMGWSFDTAVK